MKLKHNKKRNTAVLYQILIQELTKSIVRRDNEKKKLILSVIREFFEKNSLLYRDLKCYEEINDAIALSAEDFKAVVREMREKKAAIDMKELFNEQTKLINTINKRVSKSVFNNFVPNYKNLATIYQIFNLADSPSKRIVLENKLLEITEKPEETGELEHIDSLVYQGFIKKFNAIYGTSLLESQRALLQKYVISIGNDVEFKLFLNETLSSFRASLNGDYKEKIESSQLNKLNEALDSFREEKITDDLIIKVLRIQQLISELEKR